MKLLLAPLALAILLTGPAEAAGTTPSIAAALADPGRPAEDVARDAARKPGEILTFAGVKPGDTVGDFIMAGGYFTRILAKAVGPKGRVYAYQPAEFIKFKAQYGEDQKAIAAAYPNVTSLTSPLQSVAFPGKLDLVLTAQNYHDLHLSAFPADTASKVNAALFAALKPGGVLLIIDHVATAGSGLRDPDALHRIDPATVRKEVEKAGFKFEAETPILHNAADPHTQIVFDPAIRGKTDQFVYRFRKPR
jgi:predicted methyltransferase